MPNKKTGSSAANSDLRPVFERLKSILRKHEPKLVVVQDTPKAYWLTTRHIVPHNQKPLMFGGVQIMKNYVSLHFYPVYASPALRAKVSPELKKRMQGKSCFNFKTVDEMLFKELAGLTREGLKCFKTLPDFSKLTCD